jgi:pimeloyl-ACP methyl ester carboxylesterase
MPRFAPHCCASGRSPLFEEIKTMTIATPQSLVLGRELALEYVERGRRSAERPSLVMLHGVTDSWRSFEPVLPHLPAQQHVIALTQRGHGGSAKNAPSHTTGDYAADVLAAIDALDLGQPVLVGHSMGAHHALRVAVEAPERLRALVLLGAFAGFGDKQELITWVGEAVAPLVDPVPHALAEGFQRDTLARPIDPAQLETFVQESLRVPARIWREAFAGLFDDGWMQRIDGLTLPARLIWGELDAFAPRADQNRLLGWLRHSKLSVYEASGHALHWEHPVRVAAEIEAFVETL